MTTIDCTLCGEPATHWQGYVGHDEIMDNTTVFSLNGRGYLVEVCDRHDEDENADEEFQPVTISLASALVASNGRLLEPLVWLGRTVYPVESV
jgi:hypothetical protein